MIVILLAVVMAGLQYARCPLNTNRAASSAPAARSLSFALRMLCQFFVNDTRALLHTRTSRYMRPKIFVLFRYLWGLVLATCLSSCALPLGPKASATRDHAFISHWPTAADSGELRLAVKDIIDMRGEKTTGGSQYLMDTASPARHDAELMRSVRRAGVEIVGKTNMTELALGVTGENAYFGT